MTDTAKSPALAQLIENGSTLFQEGRFPEAEAVCHRALAADADNVTALDLLGQIALKTGRPQQAVEFFNRILALKPDDAKVCRNLGVALATRGDWAAALLRFQRALEIDPAYADGHIGVGNVYMAQRRYAEALTCYRKALALTPDSGKVHGNLGIVLQRLGKPDEALACYQKALALEPDVADAHNNLGNAFLELGELNEAENCFRKALQLNAAFAPAQCNLAVVLLLRGDLTAGLPLYERRFVGADRSQIAMSQETLAMLADKPRWQGEGLRGKAIFVWREQGLGDAIMMVRYLPLLKEKGAGEIIVSCHPALTRILQGIPAVDRVIGDRDPLPLGDIDSHCPLMSLPYAFGTRLETIPNAVPYIDIPPAMTEKWTPRLAALEGLKVGLVWAGSRTQRKDFLRSIPFKEFMPLLAVPDVCFVSLQKGEAPGHGVVLDWMAECEDFLDTAALVQRLDLIISVDTAVAHLAGALGRPVWLLNRFGSEWRWLLEREDSPWYPTMRIFRQPVLHDWASVIERVAEELRHQAAGGKLR